MTSEARQVSRLVHIGLVIVLTCVTLGTHRWAVDHSHIWGVVVSAGLSTLLAILRPELTLATFRLFGAWVSGLLLILSGLLLFYPSRGSFFKGAVAAFAVILTVLVMAITALLWLVRPRKAELVDRKSNAPIGRRTAFLTLGGVVGLPIGLGMLGVYDMIGCGIGSHEACAESIKTLKRSPMPILAWPFVHRACGLAVYWACRDIAKSPEEGERLYKEAACNRRSWRSCMDLANRFSEEGHVKAEFHALRRVCEAGGSCVEAARRAAQLGYRDEALRWLDGYEKRRPREARSVRELRRRLHGDQAPREYSP